MRPEQALFPSSVDVGGAWELAHVTAVHARHQPCRHLHNRDGPETTHSATYMTTTHNQVAWRKLRPPPWVFLHTALNIAGNRESQVRLSRQATAPTPERSQAAF